MAPVTSSPQESDTVMNEEERDKESDGGGTAAKPELQTVRFEWPGLPVGPSADVYAYNQNQGRAGEIPQGVQAVPAIWVPTSHGTPWQYSGLNENNVANGQPSPTPVLTMRMKNVMACGGVILVLLVVLSYFERYRLLSRFRSRRSQLQSRVKVICQVREEHYGSSSKFPKLDGSFDNDDKPPSYSKFGASSADGMLDGEKGMTDDPLSQCSCVFTSGKGKVPRVMFYDTRKEKMVMEKLGFTKTNRHSVVSQNMKINVPTQVDENDPKRDKANLVIEINDPETESGCVIGMDVLINKEDDDGTLAERLESIPFNITVEKMNPSDYRSLSKFKKGKTKVFAMVKP